MKYIECENCRQITGGDCGQHPVQPRVVQPIAVHVVNDTPEQAAALKRYKETEFTIILPTPQ